MQYVIGLYGLYLTSYEEMLHFPKSLSLLMYYFDNTYIKAVNLKRYHLVMWSFYRQYPTDYKLETYLKIARLYLEEDPVQAEAYINRASLLQADSKNEELQIHYKVIGNSCGHGFMFCIHS